MKPNEKAIKLLTCMNGMGITSLDWGIASKYSKKDLKRKCNIVVDEILSNLKSTIPIISSSSDLVGDADYWNEVKKNINEFDNTPPIDRGSEDKKETEIAMYNHKIRVWKNAVEVKLKNRRIAVVNNEQDGTPGIHLEIRRLIDKDDVQVRCIYNKIGRVAVTSMNLSDEAMQALIGAWLELRKKQGFKMQKETK